MRTRTHMPAVHRRRRLFLGAGAALALAGTALTGAGAAQADPPASPGPLEEGDVIYQVLVDRFYDGDGTNNAIVLRATSGVTTLSVAPGGPHAANSGEIGFPAARDGIRIGPPLNGVIGTAALLEEGKKYG